MTAMLAPAPTSIPLDRDSLLNRFNRKTDCQLCAERGGTYRCPWHRSEWPTNIPDEADGPPHPTSGLVPGWQAALDDGYEAYYHSEGYPEHWQDTLAERDAADAEAERIRHLIHTPPTDWNIVFPPLM